LTSRKDGHSIKSSATWRFEVDEGKIRRLSISLQGSPVQVAGGNEQGD